MPVHAVEGGYQWGRSGKVYRTRAEAERQARAIYATGWREDAPGARKALLLAHRALSPSRRAEAEYVAALVRIMGAVHEAVLHVVRREYLGHKPDPLLRQDDERDPPPIGLGREFQRRMFRWVKPHVETAFDRMAAQAGKQTTRAHDLLGIRPRAVPGLDKVIAEARTKNVALIQSASEDFLDEVRATLDEYEGLHPGKGLSEEHLAELEESGDEPPDLASALQSRAGVSRSRAILIAVDQTNKLHADINRYRQTAAGVLSFRWSTSKDERVRDSHRQLEGMTFSWDDDVRTGQMAELDISDDDPEDPAPTPGGPIRCRCIAIPLLPELDEESSAAEGDDEGA